MNEKKKNRAFEEPSSESLKAWLNEFKEALPESWQTAADQTTEWVKKNPTAALTIGTAAGVSLAFIGVGRIAMGARWALRHPVTGAFAMKAVTGVMDEFARRRPTNSSSKKKP
jgi:hypothetical protein